MEVQLHTFITLALDEGEWQASRSTRFIIEERAPGTNCTRGWVGPRVCLVLWRRENSLHLLGIKHNSSAVSTIAWSHTDWNVPATNLRNAVVLTKCVTLTNCRRTCSIDVLYRRQKTEGPGCNGGQAACIMGQWPQLVWQVATVLISPHSVSPLSSLRYPLSKLFTYPPIMPCFPSYSPSIFLFKTQNNWTFQSWNSMGFDICQFPMFVHPLSWLQILQVFFYSLLPSASVLRQV